MIFLSCPFWECAGGVRAAVLAVISEWGFLREGIFIVFHPPPHSLTVNMQLVCECSCHSNVGRLHFHIIFLGVCESSIIFISFKSFSCVHTLVAALVCSLLQHSVCFFWRPSSVWECKIEDDLEIKNSVIDCDTFPISRGEWSRRKCLYRLKAE